MKITEDYGKVKIDDFEFYGEIKEEKCSKCKFNLVYYDDFDTYFCPKCNSWTEAKCSDTTCKYCSIRPDTPLTRR